MKKKQSPVGRPKGKTLLGGDEGIDRGQWQTVVSTVTKTWIPKT
jgi:hypothetical protein